MNSVKGIKIMSTIMAMNSLNFAAGALTITLLALAPEKSYYVAPSQPPLQARKSSKKLSVPIPRPYIDAVLIRFLLIWVSFLSTRMQHC